MKDKLLIKYIKKKKEKGLEIINIFIKNDRKC